MQACFGVTRSTAGRFWKMAEPDDRIAQAIAQRHGLPELMARLLQLRGVGIDDVDDFLNPALRSIPDPSGLKDMDKAAEILADAIQRGSVIGILGDYDVDGATSTAMLIEYIRSVGGKVAFHIPDRFKEGYGPSQLGIDKLIADKAEVIVTVDCGITALDLLGTTQSEKLPVVIIDHHIAGTEIPKVSAVVNPNRFDDDFPHKNLAACGVAFLALIALNRTLRARGHFKDGPEPDLKNYLDLVALGTVADVVPLTGLNRLFVQKGVEILHKRQNPGLRALCNAGRIQAKPTAYDLGFILGPRINAGGRLGDSTLGVQLLTEKEDWRAQQIAQQLDKLNAKRQEIEESALQQAIHRIEAMGEIPPAIVIGDENWHPGVIGIMAGRLKDRYNKPCAVIAFGADGMGVASARSVSGFDIGSAILAAVQTGILIKGGGHAMAAGFQVRRDDVAALQEFLNARIKSGDDAGAPVLHIDAVVSPQALSYDLMEKISFLAPFGAGNPQPRFAIDGVQIDYAEILKDKHVRCRIRGIGGISIDAVSFRCVGTPLGQALLQSKGGIMRVAGQLQADNYNGRRKVKMIIEDVG